MFSLMKEKQRLSVTPMSTMPIAHVIVYQSYDSILAGIKSFLVMMFLFILLLVLFSRIIARLVFKDINHSFGELNQQTKEIAAGDYHPLDTDNRFDEFNRLTENSQWDGGQC